MNDKLDITKNKKLPFLMPHIPLLTTNIMNLHKVAGLDATFEHPSQMALK